MLLALSLSGLRLKTMNLKKNIFFSTCILLVAVKKLNFYYNKIILVTK